MLVTKILVTFRTCWCESAGAEDFHLLKHYLQLLLFLTLMRRWHQALIKKFRNLLLPLLSPFNNRSKFCWLFKSSTRSGSNYRGCREIWSCLKWTEFGMVSATRGTSGLEKRLRSWKYYKLGTSTFSCI